MGKYDYMAAVCDDVHAYIEENGITVTSDNRAELEEQLNEDLFCEDSVTGNGFCRVEKRKTGIGKRAKILTI